MKTIDFLLKNGSCRVEHNEINDLNEEIEWSGDKYTLSDTGIYLFHEPVCETCPAHKKCVIERDMEDPEGDPCPGYITAHGDTRVVVDYDNSGTFIEVGLEDPGEIPPRIQGPFPPIGGRFEPHPYGGEVKVYVPNHMYGEEPDKQD